MKKDPGNGPSEIEQALELILAAAKNYSGPHAREFAEIARRAMPSSTEELIGELVKHDEAQQADELVDQPEDERLPYEVESWEPKERLGEALAMLLKVAFPPDKSMEQAVRIELQGVLGIEVRSLSFMDGDNIIKMKQHLSGRPKKADRILRAALQQFIPERDSLNE